MDTKKIRIGNDIRLAVDLRQYIGETNFYLRERHVYTPAKPEFENIDDNQFVNTYELYYNDGHSSLPQVDPDWSKYDDLTTTPICIRSVKALLINTTRQEKREQDLKNKSRFISRFPIEPELEAFHSTPYDICCSGYPTWRAYPVRRYGGFGLTPDWGGLYKPLPQTNPDVYRANVAATAKQNVVEVSFPAEHQLFLGKYKLVIVAKIYAPGFNMQNLKTVTLDIPDVFELVGTSEEGSDTGFYVNVAHVIDELPDEAYTPISRDIYVNAGDVYDNSITLNRTDGSVVEIGLDSVSGWHNAD